MTRDNVLFTLCGLLAGFIVGYFVATGARAPAAAPSAGPSFTAASAKAAGGAAEASPGPTAAELATRLRDLRGAVSRDPGNADLQLQLANSLYDASDWQSAADAYERVLPTKGNDPNVLTDLGSCYRNLGRFREALEMYARAQKIQPSHAQSLLNMTLIDVFDLKDSAAAQSAFDRLKKEHPEIPRLDDLQMRISSLRAAKS